MSCEIYRTPATEVCVPGAWQSTVPTVWAEELGESIYIWMRRTPSASQISACVDIVELEQRRRVGGGGEEGVLWNLG